MLFKYKFKFVVSYVLYAFEFYLNFTNFREGTRMNEDFETQKVSVIMTATYFMEMCLEKL